MYSAHEAFLSPDIYFNAPAVNEQVASFARDHLNA